MTILSLVVCSRNDQYSGDSVYRLQTSLNFLAFQVVSLGLEGKVEVIVTDWGSETPLREVLGLTQDAASMTRFLEIPPELALRTQQDSPFTEVVANNSAIRRANGTYIGRIDQDTLVGRRFLRQFFDRVEGGGDRSIQIDLGFIFIGRRHVPLGFVRELPSLDTVVSYIGAFKTLLPPDGVFQRPWFDAPVGIIVMHRDLWHECRGYDEQLIYWGFMDTDLGLRIGRQYAVINAAAGFSRDFFHLSHTTHRLKVTNRKKNPRTMPRSFAPNDENWGLVRYKLEAQPAIPSSRVEVVSTNASPNKWHLRARYGGGVIQECAWEIGLAGTRFCRMLTLGDRVLAAPGTSDCACPEDK